jgi:hypothetical protein
MLLRNSYACIEQFTGVQMMTPLGGKPRGVDFSWNKQLGNQAGRPSAIMPPSPARIKLRSVCATIDWGKRLPAAQVKGLEALPGLTTPTSPVWDRTSTKGYDPEGKWVLHAFLERK